MRGGNRAFLNAPLIFSWYYKKMINAIGIALQGLGFATKQVAESANKIANPQEGADLAEEIVKMKIAEVSYKANLMTIRVAEDMEKDLLRTFDEKV